MEAMGSLLALLEHRCEGPEHLQLEEMASSEELFARTARRRAAADSSIIKRPSKRSGQHVDRELSVATKA